MTAPIPAGQFAASDATCLPHELPGLLDRFAGIRVLSLDCFDTLIWRDCHAPVDLFSALPGLTTMQRTTGEGRARVLAQAARQAHDVAIDAIYAAAMPTAGSRKRAAAIAAELATEARHCYAFAPTVALMREAKRRGIKVVIVSDTYLDQRQLRGLIAAAAGEDVAALIDKLFVSSAFAKPKALGLYGEVLPRLNVRPDQVLHIGDNHSADVLGVRPFGVNTVHLVQFAPVLAEQLRLESTVAGFMTGDRRGELARPQPHRAALALGLPQIDDPAQRLGFATLGPVLHGFDAWLRAEAAELAKRGGRVHWLFMLRDGYLPWSMHRAVGAVDSAHCVEISRMTAKFATLANDRVLAALLAEHTLTPAPTLGQMLRIDPAVIARCGEGRDPLGARRALGQWLADAANTRRIRADARAMAERIVAHVRATVDPEPGDTLMLVDLGYNGSVQNDAAPILAEALQVHVAGRYLLLRETVVSGLDKRGWFDRAHFDEAALGTLIANVAVLEQLCTTATGSVIDYHDDGTPLRAAATIKARQSAVREAVQAGCTVFAAHLRQAALRQAPPADHARQWREAAAAALTRLFYLPLPHELATITAFQHDVNLGTAEVLDLFDPADARRGLRQKGLFYQKGTRRMYLPAELAGEGMPLRLANFAALRFGAPLTFADMVSGGGEVPVVIVRSDGEQRAQCPARPTHDGFRALCIPLGKDRHPVAVQVGAIGRHVEIEAVLAVPTADYIHTRAGFAARETPVQPLLDGVIELAPGLWQCSHAFAFALLVPPELPDIADLMLVMVYRAVGQSPA